MQTIDPIPYPTALHTVNIFPYYELNNEVMYVLGRKEKNPFFEFIGGFVDPEKDDSTEDAALRELHEETLIDFLNERGQRLFTGLLHKTMNQRIGLLEYLGSKKVPDERYINSTHKIITSNYRIAIGSEQINTMGPGDDIFEIKTFSLKQLKEEYETFLDKKHYCLLQFIY